MANRMTDSEQFSRYISFVSENEYKYNFEDKLARFLRNTGTDIRMTFQDKNILDYVNNAKVYDYFRRHGLMLGNPISRLRNGTLSTVRHIINVGDLDHVLPDIISAEDINLLNVNLIIEMVKHGLRPSSILLQHVIEMNPNFNENMQDVIHFLLEQGAHVTDQIINIVNELLRENTNKYRKYDGAISKTEKDAAEHFLMKIKIMNEILTLLQNYKNGVGEAQLRRGMVESYLEHNDDLRDVRYIIGDYVYTDLDEHGKEYMEFRDNDENMCRIL